MLRSTCLLALWLAALSVCAVGCGNAERGAPTQRQEQEGAPAPSDDDKAEEAKDSKPAAGELHDLKSTGTGTGAGTASPGSTQTGTPPQTGAPPSQPPGLAPPSMDPAEKAKEDKAPDGAAYREDFGVEGKADEDAEKKEASGGEAVGDDKSSPGGVKRKQKESSGAGYREDFGVEARDKQPPQIANPPKAPKLGEPPKNKP